MDKKRKASTSPQKSKSKPKPKMTEQQRLQQQGYYRDFYRLHYLPEPPAEGAFPLFEMPPKKRGRKPKPKPEPTAPPVPFKKRKLETPPDVKPEELPIPEWLKTSIQMLLINFHADGAALLHSIQKEYEACFKEPKVNPEDYNFSDWESMLRSSQFKNNFHLYMEKKIPYLKGYPLSRSATITRKGGIWEIKVPESEPEHTESEDSKHQSSDSSPQNQNGASSSFKIPKLSSKVNANSCTEQEKSSDSNNTNANAEKPSKDMENSHVAPENTGVGVQAATATSPSVQTGQLAISKVPAPAETESAKQISPTPVTNVHVQTTTTGELAKGSENVTSNPLPPEPKEKIQPAPANRANPPEPHQTMSFLETIRAAVQNPVLKMGTPKPHKSRQAESDSATKNKTHKSAETEADQYRPLEMLRKSLGTPSSTRRSMDNKHTRHRHSRSSSKQDQEKYVQKEFIDSKLDADNAKTKTSASPQSQHRDFFRRDDVPSTWTTVLEAAGCERNNQSHRPASISSADLIIDEGPINTELSSAMSPEHSSSSSSLSPPHLSPQNMWPQDVDLRNAKTKTPGEINRHDPRMKKMVITSDENENDSNQSMNQNQNHLNDKGNQVQEDSCSVRRISDSTDCSAECSEDNLDETHRIANKQVQPLPVQELQEWIFKPIHIEVVSVQHIKCLEEAIQNGKIVNAEKDPRLKIGNRAQYISLPEIEMPAPIDDSMVDDMEEDLNNDNMAMSQSYRDELEDRISENASQDSVEIISINGHEENNMDMNRVYQSFGIKKENRRTLLPTPNIAPILESSDAKYLTVTIDQKSSSRSVTPFSTPTKENTEMARQYVSPSRHPYPCNGDTIPQDNFDLKSLKFENLWKAITWRSRFESNKIDPNRFFDSSKTYSVWRDITTRELRLCRAELTAEHQKYEDKPFPSRCEYFLRSSLRLVEADYRTNGQFSDPRTENGMLVEPNEVLFYVDFAGAPGGTVEFYNKLRPLAKGFGVTYQKRCYDLQSIPGVVPEFFEQFYGQLNSYNGDGSLFCSETVDTFIARVMEATNDKGVHIVSTIANVARVPFDDENDEKWKYQHLAQIMVALIILREGGNMCFKMYDLKSPFSVALLYLLYRSFKSVQVTRLSIFAPASSEKAIICLGKRGPDEIVEIIRFLQECHKILADWYSKDKSQKSTTTIHELIPISELEKHKPFMDFLRESNGRLKRNQLDEFKICVQNLRKVKSIFNKGMYRALVQRTTQLWKVELRPKKMPTNFREPNLAFRELKFSQDVCDAIEPSLNGYNFYQVFPSIPHWRFSPVGCRSKSRGFYMGVNGMPYFYQSQKGWAPVRKHSFRLPRRSLVYGEILPMLAEDKETAAEEVFTIIDGLILSGMDIRDLPYAERIKECEKFTMSCTKVFFPKMIRLAVTKAFDFMELPTFLEKISSVSPSTSFIENNNEKTKPEKQLILATDAMLKQNCCSSVKGRWVVPSGLMFFESGDTEMGFCTSVSNRIYWEWVPGMDLPLIKVKKEEPDAEEIENPIGSVSARKLINFVNRYS